MDTPFYPVPATFTMGLLYRPRMKKTLAAVLIFALFVASPALAQSTFHGNLSRTGVYPTAGPTQLNGVVWKFKTQGPIVGSPIIAGGVVYITSLDTHLYAVDQKTGVE